MDGEIKDVIEEGVGLKVVDNNGASHKIVVGFEGDIVAHAQDVYPDETEARTTTERETVGHARRYAKYHVAQETDHDTIPWDTDPDRFETVRQALLDLSDEEIEQFFGDLLAQSASHYTTDPDVDTGDLARPHELPADKIGPEGAVLYKQEIYLDDTDEIEATSGVLITYYVAQGERRTVRHGDAPDREPDAQVELSPAPLVTPGPFRDYLAYNLRCQIRDCYLMMGLEPPQQYRVLGPGQYRFTGKYQHFEMYPEYYDKDANIPGYSYEFAPDFPIDEDELGGMIDPDSNRSIYDQIKGALFSR